MKKNYLILLILAALPGVMHAQYERYFTIGPKAGVLFSSLDGVDNSDGKTGFNAGAFMVYSFQEHFGASVDLMYSMEGDEYVTTEVNNGTTVRTSSKMKANYLRLPVLANVFFGEHGNMVRPKVMLGPSLGILLSAESEVETETSSGGVTTMTSSTVDMKDNLKSTDFGAVAGAGLNIRLAEETWLNFDVNYYLGASDILDASGSDDAVKNRNLGINLGVGFGI
jgi:outer membrane protein W